MDKNIFKAAEERLRLREHDEAYRLKAAMEGASRKAAASELETVRLRGSVLAVLALHIGSVHAIGMGELYEQVYGEPWENRINDTRALRHVITALRREGIPINSSTAKTGGGYYHPAAGSELANYLRRNKIRALKILNINAKITRVSLPNYLGQCQLEMGEVGHGDEAA